MSKTVLQWRGIFQNNYCARLSDVVACGTDTYLMRSSFWKSDTTKGDWAEKDMV